MSVTSATERRDDRPLAGLCIEINFRRVAVNPDQIGYLHLPTRPTKSTDSRARKFQGESVELDAIDPKALRAMVRWCIEHHIDRERLAIVRAAEESERSWLEMIANTRRMQ